MKGCYSIKLLHVLWLLLLLPMHPFAQNVVFSAPMREDTKDIDFEVIGKMNGKILIFKDLRKNYAVSLYDNTMNQLENIQLSFLPEKTFHVDLITYPDFFYVIYQYRKKDKVYCMAAKLDAEIKLQGEPIKLDSTYATELENNKVYNVIYSDDKQKIMLFKLQHNSRSFIFSTFLFDKQLNPVHNNVQRIPFDEQTDMLSNFALDNDGDFVFTKSSRRYESNGYDLKLLIQQPLADTFITKYINLGSNTIDEVNLKVDNANGHYIINTFYYSKENQSDIAGIFSTTLDKQNDSSLVSSFIPLDDSIRAVAKKEGSNKAAFDNFFIRNIFIKKDGGYLLVAEDYSVTANTIGGNPWDRWNYMYGNPYSMNYYNYNPADWYYRPFNGPYGNQSTRYFYENVLLLGVDKDGRLQWENILHKHQYDDDNENYLSFTAVHINGEIHFLYNDFVRRDVLLADNSISPEGNITRNPQVKSNDNDYEFMPKFGRQVGVREIVIPCTYRNSICFAKIDY